MKPQTCRTGVAPVSISTSPRRPRRLARAPSERRTPDRHAGIIALIGKWALLCLFALICASNIFAADSSADFASANKLYAEGKFAAAAGKPYTVPFTGAVSALHAGEVDAELVDEVLDEAQALELLARVEPHAAQGPRRLDQPQPLVLPQRLRMHAEHLGRHADEQRVVVRCHTRHHCGDKLDT